jgi:hypothetical protein
VLTPNVVLLAQALLQAFDKKQLQKKMSPREGPWTPERNQDVFKVGHALSDRVISTMTTMRIQKITFVGPICSWSLGPSVRGFKRLGVCTGAALLDGCREKEGSRLS